RASHALDHFAGDHPVGEVALFVNLHRAQHAEVDVAAADHGEGFGTREVGGAGQFGDSFLAGVDDIGVLAAFDGIRPDAQHAVFRLQNNVEMRRHVVRHHGRDADAEVDVEAVAKFVRDAAGDAR